MQSVWRRGFGAPRQVWRSTCRALVRGRGVSGTADVAWRDVVSRRLGAQGKITWVGVHGRDRRVLQAEYRNLCSHTSAQLPTHVLSRIDALNDEFSEARMLLEEAQESMGTTYFQDDLDDAKHAVEKVSSMWQNLLSGSDVDDATRGTLQRSMGQKMAQLHAELDLILEQLHD
ncbi:hypothetical protein FVE85_6238 [Porphyridium purpureum]|uniref:Uncharacterized protein n=1 Tax=Porphyridium purpureum TaxID=35688 RepID=A0A5J4Z760_PORPP|nr:hypothetical protein FVE85_6238 [Porphyridium purpureum]|eukprot:POR0657..scf295_1